MSFHMGRVFGYGMIRYQNISDSESLRAQRSSSSSKIFDHTAAGKGALMTLVALRN